MPIFLSHSLTISPKPILFRILNYEPHNPPSPRSPLHPTHKPPKPLIYPSVLKEDFIKNTKRAFKEISSFLISCDFFRLFLEFGI